VQCPLCKMCLSLVEGNAANGYPMRRQYALTLRAGIGGLVAEARPEHNPEEFTWRVRRISVRSGEGGM